VKSKPHNDEAVAVSPPKPAPRMTGPKPAQEDQTLDLSLRPRTIGEFVGQDRLKKVLGMSIEAARKRAEVLDHVLFAGPPGLGKTSLAHIIARELKVNVRTTSGPAIERAGDLAAIVADLEKGDVLFIDEIHRLSRVIEEILYPAMEDFELNIVVGKGPSARTMKLAVKPFTLVGATTRSGLLSHPLRDRFGQHFHLEFYAKEELAEIVRRSAHLLKVKIDDAGGSGTLPRSTARRLSRVRSRSADSNCWRSMRPDSTRWIARFSRRSSTSSKAARSASRAWPLRSARNATPSRKSTSPT
jgi:Holliday junction DNA helicase RuvB